MANEGVIRLEVERANALPNASACESQVTIIGGLHWKLRCAAETSARTNNVPKLGVFVVCSYPGAKMFWKCASRYTIKLINQADDANSKRGNIIAKSFYPDSHPLGFGAFIETMDTLLDVEEGFVLDNKVIIEASISVMKTQGVDFVTVVRDFAEADETTDVCLIVEGKKVHVAKAILAMSSPTFKTMFYGKFEENGKAEIDILEVKHEDFVALLNVIYSSLYEMEDSSVEGILNIADRFNVKIVLEAVEMHLMYVSKLNIAKKLLLTETYKLKNAQAYLIYSMKTTAAIKALETTEWYPKFTDALLARILERTQELLSAA